MGEGTGRENTESFQINGLNLVSYIRFGGKVTRSGCWLAS